MVEQVVRGEVWSYTTVIDPDKFPKGVNVPYTIALIKIVEGKLVDRLVTAQLTDLEYKEANSAGEMWPKVEIGMPVEMVLRRLGVAGDPERGHIIYGYKFRPLIGE